MCNYTSRRAGKAKRKRRKKKKPPSQNSSGRLEQDFHSEASALISTLVNEFIILYLTNICLWRDIPIISILLYIHHLLPHPLKLYIFK
jgi:hypothetical protein